MTADTGTLLVALAQINPTVGDIAGNEKLIAGALAEAQDAGAQVVVFGELVVSGYPPEDLLLRDDFLAACEQAVQRIADLTEGSTVAFVGAPRLRDGDTRNSAFVLSGGHVCCAIDKLCLPNYGVFDEQRVFAPGDQPAMMSMTVDDRDHLVAVTICEDLWVPDGPAAACARAGADLIVNLSASPFHLGKADTREAMIATRARDLGCPVAYVNVTGGQDELVFDGRSVLVDHEGTVLTRAGQFTEGITYAHVDVDAARSHRRHDPRHRHAARCAGRAAEVAESWPLDHPFVTDRQPDTPAVPPSGRLEEAWGALTCATRDYVRKNGFTDVVLGLSGGIDSALVALVAVDALGADRVHCVSMPSRFSSDGTRSDARALADRLGVDFREIAIEPIVAAYDQALADSFSGHGRDVTEENLQARARGNLLMALSNKFGWLVLSTGNKSETAVGYSTLYGDAAGGLAVIKDVPKTLVFELTRWASGRMGGVVPDSLIDRPPSAELSDGQQDTDSLPPYELLDPMLEMYVEKDLAREQIAARMTPHGVDEQTVRRVTKLVDLAEYKRRQGPPGIKITPRAFGRDRRMPITNRFNGT